MAGIACGKVEDNLSDLSGKLQGFKLQGGALWQPVPVSKVHLYINAGEKCNQVGGHRQHPHPEPQSPKVDRRISMLCQKGAFTASMKPGSPKKSPCLSQPLIKLFKRLLGRGAKEAKKNPIMCRVCYFDM